MQVFHGRRPAVVARFYVVVSSVSEVLSEGENDSVSRRVRHRMRRSTNHRDFYFGAVLVFGFSVERSWLSCEKSEAMQSAKSSDLDIDL
jgi:hypothetical protein